MENHTDIAVEETAPRHRSRRAGWQNILLLTLVLWLLLPQAYKGALNSGSPITGWDFRVLYNAAERLNKGEELYTITGSGEGKTPYIYTPLVAEVLRPVARLPFNDALKVCFAASAACLLLAILFYAGAVPLKPDEVAPACIMVLVSFHFWPMVFNFGLGQINNALLMLACGMFWAERRERSGLAGVLIALAALVKVWMFGILIYPLMRRDWKAAGWAFGAYAIGLLALFAPRGLGEWSRFVHATASNAEQRFLVSQSITGFARLHFQANPHVHAWSTSPVLYYGFIGLGYAVVGAMFVYLWSRRDPLTDYEARLWFGMALLSVPLVSPLCHDEYYILALPLLWTLLTLPKADTAGWRTRISIAGVVLYALFTRPWPTSGDGLLQHQDGLGSLLVSGYFLIGVALWIVAVCSIFQTRMRSIHKAASAPEPAAALLSGDLLNTASP
ncbi:MAG TPA: glycosyltransferase family 87 protein [Chthoniobacteraceae bacterium]|jgi:alpha-1,2-mannosyltransferase|nr:glycosyltransferase family 87 protein [Chthoniobacteraceae bacterium]